MNNTINSKSIKDSNTIEDNIDNIKINIDNIDNEDNNVEILGNNQDYSLAMYIDKDIEYKYLIKFIKATEKLVRSNVDYKLWLSSLRDEYRLSQDAFYHNLTSEEVEIQLHHYPFNLFNIVQAIILQMLDKDYLVSTYTASDIVIKLHLMGKIGLVPLSVTTHELAHLGKITFLRSQIYGEWEDFYKDYKDYLEDYDHLVVKELLETKKITLSNDDLKYLTLEDKTSKESNTPEEDDFIDMESEEDLPDDTFDALYEDS